MGCVECWETVSAEGERKRKTACNIITRLFLGQSPRKRCDLSRDLDGVAARVVAIERTYVAYSLLRMIS